MRNQNEIREQFDKQFIKRLKQRKLEYLSVSHLNCKHNCRHRVKGNGRLGFCHSAEVIEKSKSFVVVCNNKEMAEDCKYYECKNTEQSVLNDFNIILRDPSFCGKEYPKLAVLLWVLQEENSKDKESSRLRRFFFVLKMVLSFSWW